MATANEQLLQAYIRHQIHILRYAGGVRNKVLPYLDDTNKELRRMLITYMSDIGGQSLTNKKAQDITKGFESDVQQLRGEAWQQILDETQSEYKNFAKSEASMGAATIEGSLPVVLNLSLPPIAQLNAIVDSQPFEGKTLKAWIQNNRSVDIETITREAKIAIVQGRTPTQLAADLVGTQDDFTTGMLYRKNRRNMEAVLRTVTNGIQQESKQALYQANSDVIQKEIFVATLDSRTTPICASDDGKTFKLGKGPMPPLHFGCRSTRAPYIDPDLMTNRPFNASVQKQVLNDFTNENGLDPVKNRDGLPRGFKSKFDAFEREQKRKLIGQVPAKTDYNQFLRHQNKAFQDDWLGETRAEIWRKNKNLQLKDIVGKDGDFLTLDQLKEKGLKMPSSN